jgi:predicted RNase H-like nuclease (RuvC/YqgF family)
LKVFRKCFFNFRHNYLLQIIISKFYFNPNSGFSVSCNRRTSENNSYLDTPKPYQRKSYDSNSSRVDGDKIDELERENLKLHKTTQRLQDEVTELKMRQEQITCRHSVSLIIDYLK